MSEIQAKLLYQCEDNVFVKFYSSPKSEHQVIVIRILNCRVKKWKVDGFRSFLEGLFLKKRLLNKFILNYK